MKVLPIQAYNFLAHEDFALENWNATTANLEKAIALMGKDPKLDKRDREYSA